MKKFPVILFAIFSILLFSSCRKSKDAVPANTEDLTTSTAVGTTTGNAVKKTIDANGGQLTSADGTLQVIIPAGALASAKEISIQAVTNQLPGGVGNAYRLLPHGEQFSKPISIVVKYKVEDLKSTIAEFLDIAYQDADGSWLALTNPVLDKVNRKITVTTTHFSDWTFFKSLELNPAEATVALSGNVDLKVTTHFPYLDPDDTPSGQPTIKVLKMRGSCSLTR